MLSRTHHLASLEDARRRGHFLICLCSTMVHALLVLFTNIEGTGQLTMGLVISSILTLAVLNKRVSIGKIDKLIIWATSLGAVYMLVSSAYLKLAIGGQEALVAMIFIVIWFGILGFRKAAIRTIILYASMIAVGVFNSSVELIPLMYLGFLALLVAHMTATGHQVRRQLSATAHYADLAMTDPLTGVCNRRGMSQLLEQLQHAKEQDIGLLLVDIDHFKRVNDTYGHEVGDHILQHVASVLSRSVRQEHHTPQDVVARWGGEEFLVLIRTQDAKLLQQIGKRMLTTLNDIETPLPKVTISIGVAQLSEVKSNAELLRLVDRRMYQAKEAGRNQLKWESSA